MFLTVDWRHERKNKAEYLGIWSTQERKVRVRVRALLPRRHFHKKGRKKRVALPGGHSYSRRGQVLEREVGRSPGLGGIGGNLEGRARPALRVSDVESSQDGVMGGRLSPRCRAPTHWLALLSPLGLRRLTSWVAASTEQVPL